MKRPFFYTLLGTTAATDTAFIHLPVLKPGQWLEPTFLGVYNNSGEAITALAGITDQGSFVPLYDKTSITSGSGVVLSNGESMFIREGEKLSFGAIGASDSGPWTAVARGWLHEGEYIVNEIAQEIQAAQATGS
ncbi:MAG: hypothetical protein ACRD4Q_00165 [Candidatus Acidiferrales bacterium]